jgi:hypothetical protein
MPLDGWMSLPSDWNANHRIRRPLLAFIRLSNENRQLVSVGAELEVDEAKELHVSERKMRRRAIRKDRANLTDGNKCLHF